MPITQGPNNNQLWFGLVSFYVRVSTITAIDDWSQIQVHTDERTQVNTPGLPWWSPIQVSTKVDVP